MNRRVFLAINLPENIKKKLARYEDKWPEIPARWTKEYNLHITLVFLGYVRDENLIDIIKKTEQVCKNHSPFEIIFNKIIYGPKDKKPAKMIWVVGDKNDNLSRLAGELENELLSGVSQNMEKYLPQKKEIRKAFSPHITLARIKQFQLHRMEEEAIPEIDENVDFNFDVNSIEVMESELKKSGPSYTILESIPLK
ncbi:MAG: RNA 2',3'-cyclic phosphodiesterase [Candidatus Nealsonbacteria bacterium]|nr:RNA 2',3'-cyclic phosphodiesterase [Candidatus Nealsonbacteria bacterium]